MPYNNRPLTLYRGQFQANAGYRFAVRSKSFDINGNKISLREDGSASIMHTYDFEIKYGVTDFIELGAGSFYMRNGIRSESSSTISGSDMINSRTLTEYRGMGDLELTAALRLPIDYKTFDISIGGGVTLPVAPYKPSEPSHEIIDYTSPTNYTINYQYNNNNGTGVPLLIASGAAKVTFSRFSFQVVGTFSAPMKEGESIRWGWTIYGTTFSYYSNPYNYLPCRSLYVDGSAHYQAAGWFNVFLNAKYSRTYSGWTESYGVKYADPETTLLTLQPGFEIQVSPSLRIYQYAGFQIAGKSTDAPFYLLTAVSYNIIPFRK